MIKNKNRKSRTSLRGVFSPPVLLGLVLFLLLPSFVTAQSGDAVDWGGFLDNSTELTYGNDLDFSQIDKVGFWLRAPVNQGFVFNMQAYYLFTLDRVAFVDFDKLNIEGLIASEGDLPFSFQYKAGRFLVSDFTRHVLQHKLDGMRFGFNLPFMSIEVGAGFTGLLFVPSNSIMLTQSDLAVNGDAPDHGFALSSPKLIEHLYVTFPGLFLRQDLLFSFLFQQDLQAEEDLAAGGGRLHTEYLGIGIRGPLASILYWDAYFYLNLGQHDSYSVLAFLAGGGFSFYIREALYSKIQLRTVFSSGDENQASYYEGYSDSSASNHYVPLTSSPFGIIFSPKLGNMMVNQLSYSIKPFSNSGSRAMKNFQTTLKTFVYVRPTDGAISEAGINSDSSQLYLGTEIDLILGFRPLSDLGFSIGGGLFIPNNGSGGAFSENGQPIEGGGRIQLSFSF